MNVTFDTNVLLRLLLADNEAQLVLARQALTNADRIALPIAVLCEAVWVMRAVYRMRPSDVADSIENIIKDERIVCDFDLAATGLANLLRGGDFADAVIAVDGRRLGAERFVTFDQQAAKLLEQLGEPVTLLQ